MINFAPMFTKGKDKGYFRLSGAGGERVNWSERKEHRKRCPVKDNGLSHM